jgi:hypothetical protein
MLLRVATATRPSFRFNPARFAPVALYCFTFFALAVATRAHDPFEAFHSAIVRADRLDLTVTMAQSTALRLIDPTGKIPVLTAENLAEHRPRLLREAAALLLITSVHTQLTARTATIELTEENDLIFRVIYPPAAAGKLFFSAAYLKKLGDGYGGIIEVTDAADKNLGWEQLLWARPNFEVTVPK